LFGIGIVGATVCRSLDLTRDRVRRFHCGCGIRACRLLEIPIVGQTGRRRGSFGGRGASGLTWASSGGTARLRPPRPPDRPR
jgi:hypothetical protein